MNPEPIVLRRHFEFSDPTVVTNMYEIASGERKHCVFTAFPSLLISGEHCHAKLSQL